MDHKEAFELLAAYLDNELSPGQRIEIEVHLAQCPLCRSELSALKAAQDSLRTAFKSTAAEVEPPARAWQQLQPELEAYRHSFLFLFHRRRWRVIATIVVLAVIVTLAVLWGTGILPGLR